MAKLYDSGKQQAAYGSMTDEELCLLVATDSKHRSRAFAELYDRLSPRIFIYCTKIFGNSLQAEDIFQETFVRLYESLMKGTAMTNVQGYCLITARNLSLTERSRTDNRYVEFNELHYTTDVQPYETQEMMSLIESALFLLSGEYREVFVLREFMGLSYLEISEVIGEELGAVRTRLYRSREMVREILTPYIKDINT